MKLIDLSTEEEKVRSLYRVVGYISLVIFLLTGTYGIVASIVQSTEVVGLAFVTTELPPPEILPFFYAKPITWLFASGLVLVYTTLELNKKRIMNLSIYFLNFTKILAFVVFGISLYEIYFNFTLWSSFMTADVILGKINPDLVVNPFPNPETSWSVVFATKIFVLLTVVTGYYLYFLNKLESEFKRKK